MTRAAGAAAAGSRGRAVLAKLWIAIAALLLAAGSVFVALRLWVLPPEPATAPLETRADTWFWAGVLAVLAVGAVASLLYAAVRIGGRWRIASLSILVGWPVVELAVAPLLPDDALPLLGAIRDPDHWPHPGDDPAGMNSDAVRCRYEAEAFTAEGCNVLFLGDSFTLGFGLTADLAYPALLGGMLTDAFPGADIKVANFGWVSSSPYLSRRRLERVGWKYHPDLVVLGVDMSDFGGDITAACVVERRGIFWLYDKMPLTLQALRNVSPGVFQLLASATLGDVPTRLYFPVLAPLDETRPLLGVLADNVAGIAADCKARGVRFLAYVFPRSFQYSARECPKNWEASQYEVLGPYCLEPFRFVDELAARADYPLYSLLDAFRRTDVFPTCFEADPHWNAAGHRVCAEAMFPTVREAVREILGR